MGAVGYAVHVALQHIPTHLIVEWIAKLIWNLQEQNNEKRKLISILKASKITITAIINLEKIGQPENPGWHFLSDNLENVNLGKQSLKIKGSWKDHSEQQKN